jgi:glyoxylase-like metal-dependent hydrolase (beta-lactamase superfamily II)
MLNNSRRDVLALGTAAAAAALMAPSEVAAQAPASAPSRQAPAFYRFKVGDAEVTVLNDGFVPRKAEGWVSNVPLVEVEAALEAAFIPKDDIRNIYNITVVKIGSRQVVFDAGFADNGQPTTGQLAANMAAAGIDPNQIDAVICTHFHPDHIHGVRQKGGALAFPKAEIMVPEPEWAFWTDENRIASVPEGRRANFGIVNRVFAPSRADIKRFAWGAEVVPGVTAIATPGHTPGHTSFVIASGNAKVLVQGDVSGPPVLFVRNPHWHSSFDADPQVAEATRRKLYDMAATERMPIIGYHAPFPGVGYVAKDGTGYRYEQAQWRSTV